MSNFFSSKNYEHIRSRTTGFYTIKKFIIIIIAQWVRKIQIVQAKKTREIK